MTLSIKNLIPLIFLLTALSMPSLAREHPGYTKEYITKVMIHWSTESITKKAKKNNLNTHISERQRSHSPGALVTHINEYVATRMPEDEYIAAAKDSIDGKLGVEIKRTTVYPLGLDESEKASIVRAKKKELAKSYCEFIDDAKFPVIVRYSALTPLLGSKYRDYESFGYFEFGKDFCDSNPDLWETGLKKFLNW